MLRAGNQLFFIQNIHFMSRSAAPLMWTSEAATPFASPCSYARVHKSPPLVATLIHINPVHDPPHIYDTF
jgi:hypothetical protein